MRRRELIAAAAGLATLSGCLDDGMARGDGDGSGDADNSPPFEVRTVDAPGSEAGTVRVPRAGRVTLLNFARTLCPTSEGFLSAVGAARGDLSSDDVDVITVVDGSSGPQPSPAELADWWVEHDGNWPVAIDERGLVNDHYDISGFPVVIAVDGDGEVQWRNDGGTTARTIVQGVRTALEAQESA
ncbi:redoxin family protein [Natronorubrum sp. JWXQ-INN-674]|uniref:Redoxin family protein n=1 Tax=Natronorubrum halalkaliphilum TaxID=2691917 RepID=A0A6B0VMD7_9EURY|nr:redoxin family protein [Natronorubrum halalkaliphilum]MXV62373.1 redoxin family protein [Natronorubrum halalkaliphilum]